MTNTEQQPRRRWPLVALGALSKARWQSQAWTEQVALLQQENASMRTATGALTEQVGSLQAALDDLDEFSPTDTERAAMARLPQGTRRQALGGGRPDVNLLARLHGPSATPDGMGVLRQMLGTLASRLEAAKPQIMAICIMNQNSTEAVSSWILRRCWKM